MDNEQKKSGIVLNRMYVGDYLSSNLGHEVINLYQADNGGHYIYLNATGNFEEEHKDMVNFMLFVKYHGIAEVEVIGMACGLKDVYQASQKNTKKYGGINKEIFAPQKEFAQKEGGITYFGVSIFDIFNDAEQQNVFITYKAEKVYIPKDKRLFIRFRCENKDKCPKHDANDIVIELSGYQQAKTSLKQYIYEDGTNKDGTQDVEDKKEDYFKIRKMLIDNKDLWKESNNSVNNEALKKAHIQNISLFDICKIQNDENKFSNALAYFMLRPKYHDLWNEFFKKFDIELGDKYTITREESAKIPDKSYDHKNNPNGGRIDLLIRTEKHLIVIENKIKSDINSVESDGDGKQLLRYYNYVKWLTENEKSQDKGKKCVFVVLTPKYNIPTIDGKMKTAYKVITYQDLYDFLSDHKRVFDNDDNFTAFHEAMYRHTRDNVNDYLSYEMQEKFFTRIIKYKNQRGTI